MSINHIISKIKHFRANIEENRVFMSLLIIFVAFASFGLGRLSLLEENHQGIKVINNNVEESTQTKIVNSSVENTGQIVASKNGTKYYFPNCSGVSRINKENIITFVSKEEAESAGYTLASGCSE